MLPLLAAFAMACSPAATSTPIPTITPEQTATPEATILTHELEVIVEPTETAIILLNPKPIGERQYVHGRTVTIDVLPQPGWEVDKWLGPVVEVKGSTAKINMTVSHSVIVSLVQSSASLPTPTPILERIAKPLPATGQPLSPPTSRGGTFERLAPPAPLNSAPSPIEREAIALPAQCSAKAQGAYVEGIALDKQSEHAKAIEKMDEVIRLDPQCAVAYSSRAFAA